MHQTLKGKASSYEPIDLFSGHLQRYQMSDFYPEISRSAEYIFSPKKLLTHRSITSALEALLEDPQNNLKITVNGYLEILKE